MLTYLLGADDLTDIRFAISPMAETVLSLRALRRPERFPLHLAWVESVRRRSGGLDWDVLMSLVNEGMGSPDFLTPRPTSPLTSVEEDLAVVAAVDRQVALEQLEKVNGTVPPAVAGQDAVGRVTTALRGYWEALIAPHWARMHGIMSADIVYRGRVQTEDGSGAMLDDLGESFEYERGELRVSGVSDPSRTEAIGGRGLTLLPTMFGPHAAIPYEIGGLPELFYPARGQGLMWSTPAAVDAADLGRLIGPPRARILTLLEQPHSTAHLARLLGVTPSAVSQHLRLLHRFGLVNAARHGRYVLYERTDLGSALHDGSVAGPSG
ncbi:MAG TPA: ArsR family transcriptional regulator [Nocardioidaceae bacterium]|nr:ArsR family transcriptional regulator [Nocardioidaceae bacterium]